jgi:hypothetical protein
MRGDADKSNRDPYGIYCNEGRINSILAGNENLPDFGYLFLQLAAARRLRFDGRLQPPFAVSAPA